MSTPTKAGIAVSDFLYLFVTPEGRYEYKNITRPEMVEQNEAALAGMTVEEYRAYQAAAEQKAAKKAADARAKLAAQAAAEKSAAAQPEAAAPAERPRALRPRAPGGLVQFPRGRSESLAGAASMPTAYMIAIAVVVAGGAYYVFKGR
jgi:hypothetical protein